MAIFTVHIYLPNTVFEETGITARLLRDVMTSTWLEALDCHPAPLGLYDAEGNRVGEAEYIPD